MVRLQLVYLVFSINECSAVINWANMGHSVMSSLVANGQVRALPDEMKAMMNKFAADNNLNQPQPNASVQLQPSTTTWPSIINDSKPESPTDAPSAPPSANPPAPQNAPPVQATPAPPAPASPPSPTPIPQPRQNSDNSSKQNRKNQNPVDSENSIDSTTVYYTEYSYSSTHSSASQTQSSSSSKASVVGSRMDFGFNSSQSLKSFQTSQLILICMFIASICIYL